ncbi:MAG: response regulator [Elusimicrobiota bacterium]|jgi:DNA-binding response OmpR family regulator
MSPIKSPSETAQRMRAAVLVADDDSSVRGAVMVILAGKFEVQEAAGGRDALDAMALASPDLLILDLSMPDMGGIEVLTEVRRTNPDLPVLILTAENDVGQAVRALDLGAKTYLTKPFEPSVLMEEVVRALAGSPDPAKASARPWRVVT